MVQKHVVMPYVENIKIDTSPHSTFKLFQLHRSHWVAFIERSFELLIFNVRFYIFGTAL